MYTTIIHPIRKALCLSCNEYIILDQIWRLSKNEKYGNWCVASKKQIAEWMDLSERTIFNAIEVLLKKELIVRNDRGFLKSSDDWNEQMANSHNWTVGFKGNESQYLSGKVNSDAGGMQKVQSDSANIAEVRYAKSADNINNTNIKNNITNMCMEDFEQFWSAYPVHRSKADALKKFLKLPRDLLPQMLSAIENQKKEKARLIQANKFCPEWKLPATWINKKCWEDEITNTTTQSHISNNPLIF